MILSRPTCGGTRAHRYSRISKPKLDGQYEGQCIGASAGVRAGAGCAPGERDITGLGGIATRSTVSDFGCWRFRVLAISGPFVGPFGGAKLWAGASSERPSSRVAGSHHCTGLVGL